MMQIWNDQQMDPINIMEAATKCSWEEDESLQRLNTQ
jgi:hypothetical protein